MCKMGVTIVSYLTRLLREIKEQTFEKCLDLYLKCEKKKLKRYLLLVLFINTTNSATEHR